MNALSDDDDIFRASVIGAGEVAALFDASPWVTEFELHHRKAGTIDTPEFVTDERQEAGVRMERAIIEWACDKWGYERVKTPKRLHDETVRIGGHPDQFATCPARGKGVLEIKTVDYLRFRDWGDEPPLQYQLQAITYAGLAGLPWADLIILVGGNQLERFQIEARPKVYAEICRRVAAFWQRIAEGNAPLPNFERDGEAIGALYRDLSIEEIDLTQDNLAPEACAAYLKAAAEAKDADERKKAAQAEIMFKMAEAAANGELPPVKRCIAKMAGFKATATLIDEIPDRNAEPGEIIKGRKAYRRLTIKEEQA